MRTPLASLGPPRSQTDAMVVQHRPPQSLLRLVDFAKRDDGLMPTVVDLKIHDRPESSKILVENIHVVHTGRHPLSYKANTTTRVGLQAKGFPSSSTPSAA